MTASAMPRAHRVRVALALLAAMSAVIATVLATAASHAASADTTGSSVTVTQPDPSLYAYNVKTKKLDTAAPTITVSQTQNLVNQVVHVSWTNFSPSINTTGAVGYSPGNTYYAVGVYECRANPQVSFYGATAKDTAPDCYNYTTDVGTLAPDGVGNAVHTFTAADGTGEADIQVETTEQNSYLKCDEADPCSIAVVPNWGGIQDTTKDVCSSHKHDQGTNGNALDSYIGEDCSWADRLSIPISFAATPSDCGATGTNDAFNAEGSPMLQRAMAQWQPAWCASSSGTPLSFSYDSGINEYEARQDFESGTFGSSSTTDAALTTQGLDADGIADGPDSTIRYAPVANTAIAIAFEIDDPSTGKELTSLNLDARLVAKMLTQSYSLRYNGCTVGQRTQTAICDPAVIGNPRSIVNDPEFKALNPALFPVGAPIGIATQNLSIGEFLPIIIEGNSDLIEELTAWIAHDPAASSFLAGTPDPYGMHVNTYYKGIHYPVSQLQQLDPGFSDPTQFPGYGTMQITLNPVNGLQAVAQDLSGNQTTATDPTNPVPAGCGSTSGNTPCRYGPKLPEQTGTRVLFAVMDEGDAAAFDFPTASLLNAAGDYVAPTSTSISAGVQDMATDTANGVTQAPNFTTADPGAYPLASVDYAAVHTCGMGAAGTAVGKFLTLATGSTAQTAGDTVGSLAQGYAALTSSQLAQTTKVAGLVAHEKPCPVAAVAPASTSAASTPPTSVLGETDSQPAAAGSGATGASGAAAGGSSAVSAGAAGGTGAVPTSGDAPRTVSFGTKAATGDPAPSLMWPVLIIAAALLLLGGPAMFLLTSETSAAGRRAAAGLTAAGVAARGSAAGAVAAVRGWRKS